MAGKAWRQESEAAAHIPSAVRKHRDQSWLQDSSPWIVLPTFRVDPPSSVKYLWKRPHTHSEVCFYESAVMPNPIKLTVRLNVLLPLLDTGSGNVSCYLCWTHILVKCPVTSAGHRLWLSVHFTLSSRASLCTSLPNLVELRKTQVRILFSPLSFFPGYLPHLRGFRNHS